MKQKNNHTGVDESNQGHRAKMNSSDRSGLEDEEGSGVVGPAWWLGCASACVALTLWTQSDAGDGDGRIIRFVVGPVSGAVDQVREARIVEFETLVCVVPMAAVDLTEFLYAGLVSAGHILRGAMPSGAAGV